MAVNKVVYGNKTLIDMSTVTVTPDTLSKGVTAFDKSGELITGNVNNEVDIAFWMANGIIFRDYDGTVLFSYTLDEFTSLTELPEPPTHSGLVFQGWNMTLDEIKAMGHEIDVSALYTTDDGKTRINILLNEYTGTTATICCDETIEGKTLINWGDGSSEEVFTSTYDIDGNHVGSMASHTYANIGDYTITLEVLDGNYLALGCNNAFYVDDAGNLQAQSLSSDAAITSVYIGDNVKSISGMAFIGQLTQAISFTKDVEIGAAAFQMCNNLRWTSIQMGKQLELAGCGHIPAVNISNKTTIIDSFAYKCMRLERIVIPSSVIEIKDKAFDAHYIGYVFVHRTTPPALGQNVFSSDVMQCIYVPKGTGETYKAADGWSDYADCIQEMDV